MDSVPANNVRGHAPDTIALRRVIVAAALVLAVLLIGAVVAALLEQGFGRWFGRSIVVATPPPVAGPKPQPQPKDDLAAFDAEKRALLNEYAWIDPARGVVRIPIERAMRIIAQRNERSQGEQ